MKLRFILVGVAALIGATPALSQEVGIENKARAATYDVMKGKKVVYMPQTMTADLTIAWNDVLQHEAKDLGFSLEVRDINYNTEQGARALASAIDDKVDLIVLQNSDVQSYAKLIEKAKTAGVKIIQLNMESLRQSDAYIGADWQGIGEAAGRAVVEKCAAGKGPSTKVAIVDGVPTAPVDEFQVYGFRKILASHPEIQIVSQQAANYDATKARAVTASVLQQHPDLCASFGIWDSMDAGSGAAVKEAGKTGQVFVVTSGGGNQTSCDKVQEGIFSLLISYDTRIQGTSLAVQVAEELQSQLPAGSQHLAFYTPNTLITKDNIRPDSCWTMKDLPYAQ
jgi:ABC-type sugar transport system substrate-binding protein